MRLTKFRLALIGSAVALSGAGGSAYFLAPDLVSSVSGLFGASKSEEAAAPAEASSPAAEGHGGSAPQEGAAQDGHATEQAAAGHDAGANSAAADKNQAEGTHGTETAAGDGQGNDSHATEQAATGHETPVAETAADGGHGAAETSLIGGIIDKVLGLVGLGGGEKPAEHATADGHGEDGKLRLDGVKDPQAAEGEAASHGETADAGHGGGKDKNAPQEVVPPDVYYEPRSAKSAIIKGVRRLNAAQDAAASGAKEAGPAQKEALIALDGIVRNLDTSTLTQPDVNALAIYLLSGGPPEPVAGLIGKAKLRKKQRMLIEAALKYVTGDKEGAAKDFATLVPEDYPPALASRLAMAQAQLLENLTNEEKKQKLIFAGVNLPGTLIEEASLRRLLALSVAAESPTDFLFYAEKYQRHYSNSLYYGEFRRTFSSGLAQFEKSPEKLNRLKLRKVLLTRPRPDAAPFLLDTNLSALREGKGEFCRFLASVGADLPGISEDEALRFRLYKTACGMAEGRDAAASWLKTVPRDRLNATDRAMLEQIEGLLNETEVKEAPLDSSAYKAPPVDPAAKDHDDFMASVAQQLKATSDALERASQ